MSWTRGEPAGAILAVDDTPANLAALAVVLEPLGYVVDRAGSGAEALRLARQKEYDLFLIDLRMPVMDGVDSAKKLREQGHAAPILLMSAYDPMEQDLEGLASLEPVDLAVGLHRPDLLLIKIRGWLALQTSVRTWRALARELAVENDRLRGQAQSKP